MRPSSSEYRGERVTSSVSAPRFTVSVSVPPRRRCADDFPRALHTGAVAGDGFAVNRGDRVAGQKSGFRRGGIFHDGQKNRLAVDLEGIHNDAAGDQPGRDDHGQQQVDRGPASTVSMRFQTG